MKKILTIAIILLAIGTVFTACSGKKENSGTGTASTATSSQGNANDNLYDIPHDKIIFGSSLDRTAVLAEIPAEMFKGIGELNTANVWADNISSYKYTVVLKFDVNSNENAFETLSDFYKSKGATVEATGNRYNPYSIKFSWGESTEVKLGRFEGQDSLSMQFSVVK